MPRWAGWAIGGVVALAVVIYVYKRATAAPATAAAAPSGALQTATNDQGISNLQNADAAWTSQIQQQLQAVLANDQAIGAATTAQATSFNAGLTQVQSQVTALQNALSSATPNAATVSQFSALQTQVQDLNSQIAALKNAPATPGNQAQLDQLQAEYANLQVPAGYSSLQQYILAVTKPVYH